MTSLLSPPATIRTLADLLDRLGGISAERVRFHPAPGTAIEADVIAVDTHEDRICELFTLPLSDLFSELDRQGNT